MTDRELTHFYGIIGVFLTVMVALIQSQRVRSWFFLTWTSWRSRKNEQFNAHIQSRIDLITELATSPGKAQAYFFAKSYFLLILFLVVFFFSIMLLLRVEVIASIIGFFVVWAWLLIAVGEPFEIAVRLRNPNRYSPSFARLRSLRRLANGGVSMLVAHIRTLPNH